jgi:flagella basal body P-ring formation protein FlgA
LIFTKCIQDVTSCIPGQGIGEARNVYIILVGKPEVQKNYLLDPERVTGKVKLKSLYLINHHIMGALEI